MKYFQRWIYITYFLLQSIFKGGTYNKNIYFDNNNYHNSNTFYEETFFIPLPNLQKKAGLFLNTLSVVLRAYGACSAIA